MYNLAYYPIAIYMSGKNLANWLEIRIGKTSNVLLGVETFALECLENEDTPNKFSDSNLFSFVVLQQDILLLLVYIQYY